MRSLKNWATRQIERRVRAEWDQYQHEPEVKLPLFRRRRSGEHITRSLIQINFHGRGRSPGSDD